MKHPLQTVHRQAYGLLYRLLNRHHTQDWHKNLSFRYTVLFTFIFFLLLLICALNIPKFNTSEIKPDSASCMTVSFMKAQYNILLETLKYHLTLQSLILQLNVKDESQFSKYLYPITQRMLEKKIQVCPLMPPGLLGFLEVNESDSTIDEDLAALATKLKQSNDIVEKMYDGNNTTHSSQNENAQTQFFEEIKKVDVEVPIPQSYEKVSLQLPLYLDKIPYGVNSPTDCFPHRRTAIVIPYRNRKKHLDLFLRHIHSVMRRQQVEYGIYVINLAGNVLFNRAKLLNVGYKEAIRHHGKYDCIIFHDVDLFPENDENIYTCGSQPKHMSVSINIFDYKLPYPELFGGVTAMTPLQFEMTNGYSNLYWGWGGEDDDMYQRLSMKCMNVSRDPASIARYHMTVHAHDKGNEYSFERFNLLYGARLRMPHDGLSTLKYTAISRDYQLLYNNITVTIGYPDFPYLSTFEMQLHIVLILVCLYIVYTLFLKRSNT